MTNCFVDCNNTYKEGLSSKDKITMHRSISSGDISETDLYGGQQYIPLLDIEIPWDDEEI